MLLPAYPHTLHQFRPGIIPLQDYLALPDCYEFISIDILSSLEEAFKLVEEDFDNEFNSFKEDNSILEDPGFEILSNYCEDLYCNRFLLIDPSILESEKAANFIYLLSNVICFNKSDINVYDEEDRNEIYEWMMEGEQFLLIKLEINQRDIIQSPILKLKETIQFYENLTHVERKEIEPGGYHLGPKYIDLIDRFFFDHNDCISFFVNAEKKIIASNNGKCLATLERTSPQKWTYTLGWEDGKYVGEYIIPFKPSYENFIKFNIGSKILGDQLRYYIWKGNHKLIPLYNNIFADLTYK